MSAGRAALGAVALLAVVAGCGDAPAPPREIAYTVVRDGGSSGEIWAMDADGRRAVELTAEGGSPAWSPDGTRVAFVSASEISVMDADGSGVTRLTHDDEPDAAPAWSPDGTRLAFAHGAGAPQIVVIDAKGGNRAEVTRPRRAVADGEPAWSPDGRLIAFTRVTVTADGKLESTLMTVAPDGGGERVVTLDAAEPAWSPDGRRIAYASRAERSLRACFGSCTPGGEIYVVLADGTEPVRLTTSAATDRSPAWAPDGRNIAFVSDRSDRAAEEYEIWVVGADGTGLRRLTTNDVWDLDPTWH